MTYITLLPTNAISSTVSQTNVYVSETDSVSFATTSAQDYSFVSYVTLSLHENKYLLNSFEAYYLQFVKISFALPSDIKQNVQTGLIPLNSLRYIITDNNPSEIPTTAWQNPCHSSDGSGYFDIAENREIFASSGFQDCALHPHFCRNPVSSVIENGLVDFWLPLGNQVITEEMLASSSQYSIYIYHDISAVLNDGRLVVKKLFATAKISSLSILRHCSHLEVKSHVEDIIGVSLSVGMAATTDDFDSSVTHFRDLLRTPSSVDDFTDTTLEVNGSLSVEMGLLTFVTQGDDATFSNSFSSVFSSEVDELYSLHFLDDDVYHDMVALIQEESAFKFFYDETDGRSHIDLTPAAAQLCLSAQLPGDFTCAVRRDILNRSPVHDKAFDLARGTHETVDWLQSQILGVSDFAKDYATNFTRLIRNHYDINDRYNRAWFVSPFFPWETQDSQHVLSLHEKTIFFGIISLEDYNNQSVFERRRLLSFAQNDEFILNSLHKISESPGNMVQALQFSGVNNHAEIVRLLGLHNGDTWFRLEMQISFVAPVENNLAQVKSQIVSLLKDNLPYYAPEMQDVFVVRTSLQVAERANRRRNLLQQDDDTRQEWSGKIHVILPTNFTLGGDAPHNLTIVRQWIECALVPDMSDHIAVPIECNVHAGHHVVSGFVSDISLVTCGNVSDDSTISDETACANYLILADRAWDAVDSLTTTQQATTPPPVDIRKQTFEDVQDQLEMAYQGIFHVSMVE